MTSPARPLRFGVSRAGCIYEHLICAPTSEETREQFEGRNSIVPVSGGGRTPELVGKNGIPRPGSRADHCVTVVA
jgi:hypothetical protein